jgi:hypothetical protein
MKNKSRTNENPPAADPKIRIGGLIFHRSILKNYLENFNGNAEFNLFPNPRSNKATGTWIKNNLGNIVKAVGSSRTK